MLPYLLFEEAILEFASAKNCQPYVSGLSGKFVGLKVLYMFIYSRFA